MGKNLKSIVLVKCFNSGGGVVVVVVVGWGGGVAKCNILTLYMVVLPLYFGARIRALDVGHPVGVEGVFT